MVLDIGDPALDSDQVSLKTYTVHKRHSGFKRTHGDQKYDLTSMFFFFQVGGFRLFQTNENLDFCVMAKQAHLV